MPLPTLGNLSGALAANAPATSIGGGTPLAGGISAPSTPAQNRFPSGVGPGAPAANAPATSIGGGPPLGQLSGAISAPYTAAQNQFLSGAGPGALNPANNPFQQMGNIQPATGMSPPPPTTGAGYAPFMPPSSQVTQALRGIPPGILQQLHSSGLIHPQLMSHVFRV